MTEGTGAAPGARRRRRVSAYAVAVVAAAATTVLLGFVSASRYELLSITRALALAALTTAVAVGLLTVVLWRRPRLDADRAGLATAVLVWWFFSFDLLFRSWATTPGVRLLQVGLWTLVAVVLARLTYEAARFAGLRDVALGALVVAVVVLGALVGSYRLEIDDSYVPEVAVGDVGPLAHGTPNVYWIVLDEYGRTDQLEHVAGIDNRSFDAALAERDFEVSGSSWASYTRTAPSFTSTLYQDYVFEPDAGIRNEYVVGGRAMRGENPTVERFRRHGYRFVYAPAGTYQWSACTTPPADRCVDPPDSFAAMDDYGKAVIDRTPLSQLDLFHVGTMDLDTIADVAREEVAAGGPFFLAAHVMSPHWPYRWNEDCTPRSTPTVPAEATGEERAALYAQDLRCLNAEVLDSVDAILAVDPGAVVIVQSDHGSGFTIDLHATNDDWTDVALSERLAVLDAVRLPEPCRDDDRYDIEGQPLVNTFRIVFACLEGTDPELLAHRVFLWPFDQSTGIEELDTSRLTLAGPPASG